MEDKRLIKRLTDYWTRLREDRPLPQWEKFNIGSLVDIWVNCCVWRVDLSATEQKTYNYTFDYIGQNAKEAMGADLTGLAFKSHLQKFPAARIAERIDDVIETVQPLTDEGSFVNTENLVVKYRSCLLPFGTVDGRITHVILGLSWKKF